MEIKSHINLTMEDIGCNYPLPVYDPPVFLYKSPNNTEEDLQVVIQKCRSIAEQTKLIFPNLTDNMNHPTTKND
jgi:hypothetical protein